MKIWKDLRSHTKVLLLTSLKDENYYKSIYLERFGSIRNVRWENLDPVIPLDKSEKGAAPKWEYCPHAVISLNLQLSDPCFREKELAGGDADSHESQESQVSKESWECDFEKNLDTLLHVLKNLEKSCLKPSEHSEDDADEDHDHHHNDNKTIVDLRRKFVFVITLHRSTLMEKVFESVLLRLIETFAKEIGDEVGDVTGLITERNRSCDAKTEEALFYLLSNESDHISGKVFDLREEKFDHLQPLKEQLLKTDVGNLRRIVESDRKKSW